jgi:hypothetical protein
MRENEFKEVESPEIGGILWADNECISFEHISFIVLIIDSVF